MNKEQALIRYCVSHYSGMTRDSEYEELVGALVEEELVEQPIVRKSFLVRSANGGFTEYLIPYLWVDREGAEKFANKLNRKAGRKAWIARELDGIPIGEMLEPSQLNLPEPPKVATIEPRLYTDSVGDEALEIWVTFSEDSTEDELDWAHLGPIDTQIRDSLQARGVDLWPYLRYRTAQEAEAQSPGR